MGLKLDDTENSTIKLFIDAYNFKISNSIISRSYSAFLQMRSQIAFYIKAKWEKETG